jgi:hypothetical protein
MKKILLPSFIVFLAIFVFGASYYYESHLDNSFQADLYEAKKNIRNDSVIIANAEMAIRNHELKDSLLIELESNQSIDDIMFLKDEISRITNELEIAKRETVSSEPIIVNIDDLSSDFEIDSLNQILADKTTQLEHSIELMNSLRISLKKAKAALQEAHYANYIALTEKAESEEGRLAAEKRIHEMKALQDSLDIEENNKYALPDLIIYGPFDENGNKIESDSLEFDVKLVNKANNTENTEEPAKNKKRKKRKRKNNN